MPYTKKTDAKGTTRYKLDNKFVKGDSVPDEVKKALDLLEDGTEFDPSKITISTTPEAIADDGDEDSTIDETITPIVVTSDDGMGFPRVDGKTVDIFNNKPHEAVRFVAGQTVPLTTENYNIKTDAEIIKKLEEMGIL